MASNGNLLSFSKLGHGMALNLLSLFIPPKTKMEPEKGPLEKEKHLHT